MLPGGEGAECRLAQQQGRAQEPNGLARRPSKPGRNSLASRFCFLRSALPVARAFRLSLRLLAASHAMCQRADCQGESQCPAGRDVICLS